MTARTPAAPPPALSLRWPRNSHMRTILAPGVSGRNFGSGSAGHDGGMELESAGRKLRHVRDDFLPISDQRLTLILVRPGEPARFGTTAVHKRELFEATQEGDELLVVWAGKRESHVFEVLPEMAALWEASLVSF